MDIEIQNNINFQKKSDKRTRGIHRFRYEAEVEVIKRQFGDLEQIRKALGLSQRKICQLLMVDPSAWTRWLKTKMVPPHIYRALSWYLMVVEKSPLSHQPNYETLRVQMDMIITDLEKARKEIRTLRRKLVLIILAGLLGLSILGLLALN